MNAAFVSGFEVGDEVAMTEFLSDTWANMRTEDIWVERSDGNIVNWLMDYPSLYDTTPAFETIKRITSPFGDFKRKISVTANDINTGELQTFNQDNISFEELPYATFGSASIPLMWPPTHFRDYQLIDGGSVFNINLESAIR